MSGTKREQIEKFLLDPINARRPRLDVARLFDVSVPYVSYIAAKVGVAKRHKWRSTPLIPAPWENKAAPKLPDQSLEHQISISTAPEAESLRQITSATQVEEIAHSKTLSPQQQREKLSWLATFSARDEAKVAALRALAALDAALGQQTKLGPGEPLSDEAKIFRLSLLMEALGPTLTDLAYAKAFAPAPKDSPANEPAPSS